MEEFVTQSLFLLRLEREQELAQMTPSEALAKENALFNLQVCAQAVGLYGRQVVDFRLGPQRKLPSSKISVGDIVGVFVDGAHVLASSGLSGVVTEVTSSLVTVAFDELPESADFEMHSGSLQLVKLANDVTYSRITRALEELAAKGGGGRCHHLVSVLFNSAKPAPPTPGSDTQDFFNSSLDESQRQAVLFSLSRPDVAVVHGPPGTGKTTAVVEVVLQSVHRGMKVLACAPSNIAVDNLVERLAATRTRMVRIGHPARMVEAVHKHSLEARISSADSATIIRDVRNDIKKVLVECAKARSSAERRKWRGEVKTLKKELHAREAKAIKEVLCSCDVVLSTVTGCSPDSPLKYLADDHFDVVVIDECAQAIEGSCWIPLLRAPKCVLAGDHKQLPPTILSHKAMAGGLAVSLMERLMSLYGSEISVMLTTQYRMNKAIMSCPSQYFYSNSLQAHHSVADHLLSDLFGAEVPVEVNVPLLYIDTAGCDLTELDTPLNESKGNEGEADLAVHHLKQLLSAGVGPSKIAMVAPYNLQVDLLQERLEKLDDAVAGCIEVRTIDGFQGREMEAIIFTFTRSNVKGECGFLHEQRRINVAVTRARRHLALIGDSRTLCNEPFIKSLIEFCHNDGVVRSAKDYIYDEEFEEHRCYVSKDVRPKPAQQKPPTKRKTRNESSATVMKPQVHKGDRSVGDSVKGFHDQLVEFIEGKEDVLCFPSALSSNDRRLIHELSDKMDLIHLSENQGDDRYIQVRKKTVKADPKSETPLEPPVSKVSLKDEPKIYQRTKQPQRKAKTRKQVPPSETESLDDLLAEVKIADSLCSFQKCKKKVSLIGVQCSFCKQRFCIEHNIPEVHGCSEAVKFHSKREARKAVQDKPTASKRGQLQQKLERSINDKSQSRTRKPAKKS